VTYRSEVVADPQWIDIETAIRRLNDAERNDVYLHALKGDEELTWLSVGGGAGKYLVTGSQNDERFPILENPSGSETEMVSLCVGGQGVEYPARFIVDLDSALDAVRRFFIAGDFDCGVAWHYRE
jgi:hypothetical protein